VPPEALPLSCKPSLPTISDIHGSKKGEEAPVRRHSSPKEAARLSRIGKGLSCHLCASEIPPPEQSVRVPIAIDDDPRDEPAPTDPADDRHPIQLEILILDALVSAKPALLDTRFPEEIAILRRQKPSRQSLSGATSELDFEPCRERPHHPIRRLNLRKNTHDRSPSGNVLLIEDTSDETGGGVAVRAAKQSFAPRQRTWGEPIWRLPNWGAPAGLESRAAARHTRPDETSPSNAGH
jgi:hypothetical protein